MKMSVVTLFVITSLMPMINAGIGSCRKRWFPYNGHCYYISMDERLPFPGATAICRNFGGGLVQLETFAENTFLKGILGQFNDTWMGLTDLTNEGVWQWQGTNNVTTISDWASGQPDNRNNEDCVAFSRSAGYRWKVLSCYYAIAFVCEKD